MKSNIIQKIIFNISNYLKCVKKKKKNTILNFYIKCYLNKLIWIYKVSAYLFVNIIFILFILSLDLSRLSL